MEQNQNINSDLKDTINYVFKMDEKEVFFNELQNLIEEIDNSGLTHSKASILINFLLYKLNVLENHQEIAKGIMKRNKPDENSILVNVFIPFCKKEVFNNIRDYMINILIDKLLEIEEMNLEFFKSCLTNVNSQYNSTIKNNELNLIKYFERKFQEKNRNANNININNNYDSTHKNLIDVTTKDIVKTEKKEIKNLVNLKREFKYKLKIFYLDGTDNYSQNCYILSSQPLDYSQFIYKLKKKLGIYEHAKFRIIILNKNKEEKEFLENISQLKLNDLNELKIVPDNYTLEKSFY